MEANGLYGAQNSKAQNIKFIVTTALVALVILGIAVWAIIFMVGQRDKVVGTADEETGVTTAIADQANQEVVEVTELNNSSSTEAAADNTPETNAAASVTLTSVDSSNIPKTGPEDLLPVAMLAGTAVAYLGSRKLAREA